MLHIFWLEALVLLYPVHMLVLPILSSSLPIYTKTSSFSFQFILQLLFKRVLYDKNIEY